MKDRQPTRVRFGAFELDLKSGELSSVQAGGRESRIVLPRQPFQLLLMLVAREGAMVTREEIQKAFWPNDTIVEFNHSINVAIGKLRKALGDSASEPQYVATVASRGYRLMALVEWIAVPEDSSTEPAAQMRDEAVEDAQSPGPVLSGQIVSHYRMPDILSNSGLFASIAGACVIVAVVLVGLWRTRQHSPALTEVALTQNSFEAPVVDAAISPDGNLLAYADASGLNLKVISSGEVRPLFNPADARIVRIAWFPDSSNLLFTSIPAQSAERQLWSGSIFKGVPRLLRADADDASVSADGSELVFSNGAHDEIWASDAKGGNARKLVAKDGFYLYHPAWYAGRQRILYLLAHELSGGSAVADASLESLDLKTGQSLTVCKPCIEFAPPSDGRLLYATNSSLWKVAIDERTAQPTGPPSQIAGTRIGNHPTVSADGKRLVILKGDSDPASGLGAVIVVADLEDKGRRLSNTRRLTLGVSDYAHAWTPDSRAVVFESERNGRYNIFEQRLDRSGAEPLVADSQSTSRGRFSPTGDWMFYVAGNTTSDWRLMRMAASGGPSELVLEGQGMENYYCSAAAANLCVVAEREQSQLVFYALDQTQKQPPGGVLRKDLKELARTDYNPTDWGLSPDGATLAMVRPSNREGRIHMISLQGRDSTGRPVGTATAHDVLVEGWTNLFNLNWTTDGTGWYICSRSDPVGSTFLFVDLKGHATVLQSQQGVEPFWGVPSPDGHHLAFSKTTFTENAWLLKNF